MKVIRPLLSLTLTLLKKTTLMEEVIMKKVIGGLMGLKNKTKEPKEVAGWLVKLKKVNEGMYEEYLVKYKSLTE